MELMKTDEVPNHLDSPKPSENSCCRKCVYYDKRENICIAFAPKKIPKKYLSGEEIHTTVDDDQVNPFVFGLNPRLITY